MKNNFEDKFLDYLDGVLSEEEKSAFEKALELDAELKKSFEDYKKIISTERIINMQKHELNANFAVKVMDRIENKNKGFFRRYFMDVSLNSRPVKVFASLAVIICVVQFYRARSNDAIVRYNEPYQLISADLGADLSGQAPAGPVVAKSLEERSVQNAGEELAIKKEGKLESRRENLASGPSSGKQKILIGEQGILGGITKAGDAIHMDDYLGGTPQAQVAGAISAPPPASSVYAPMAGSSDSMHSMESKKRLAGVIGSPHVLYNTTMQLTEPSVAAGLTNAGSSLERRYLAEQHFGRPLDVPQKYAVTEAYNAFEENPRTEVSKEPSSTFSIDVDTASYANARRFLKEGSLPPKDSIRVEEFLNYFDYNYPQQYEKPFSLNYEIAPSPLEKDRYLLKLGVKAKDKKETGKPWNLVFLVDISGSMNEINKLPLVQRSLRLLTENMKEGDKVAIVTYAGSAGTVLESTTISDKAKILAAIDSLSAGGSTNGSGGIQAAYDLALKNKIEGAVNRVVLATDGDFNVGVTSQSELIRLIEEKRKSGITLTTLGFGTGNIQEGTMEQLANKGNGNFYYIDSYKEARKVLETDIAGTMEVVAKDVKLQIEFNPQHVQSFRLIGYENRKLKREDFNNDAIDAGEIGTGHTVTALYEIVLTNSPLAQKLSDEYRYQEKEAPKKEVKETALTSELAFLKIRYKEPEGSESALLSFPIEKSNVKSDVNQSSQDFKFAAAVSYFGHLLRDSQYKGSYSYKDIIELAQSGKGEDKNGYRQEFIELLKDAASIK